MVHQMIQMTVLSLGLLSSLAVAQPQVEAGKYQIDPMHSKVGFEVPHLVISTVEGSFKEFEGEIELASDFTRSSIQAKVAIESIDTGVGKRDEHLRSPDFFDAKKYPEMLFRSAAIRGTPAAFKVDGDLTIKGVSKRVTLDGKFLGTVSDGYGNRKAVFQAKTKIDRRNYGLTWSANVEAGPVVGDEITIDLRIQAARPLSAKQASK